jgi:putative endonuclease
MAWVYIIYSSSHDKFYIGFTNEDPSTRLMRHNSDYYQDKFTSKYKPWDLFWTLECETSKQAQQIERHIKGMKSKTYIQNLTKYPEIGQKLLSKYNP